MELDITSITLLGILIVISFVVGWLKGYNKAVEHMVISSGLLKRLQEEAKSDVPSLVTEKHGEMFYVFENGTDTFVTQGATLEEIAKNFYDYKKVNVAYVKHGDQHVWFVNGEVKENHES